MGIPANKHSFNLKGKKAEALALRTFLTDWCYINPKLPNGRELCDLLVVFDETAIIWQIKDLKLDVRGFCKENEIKKNLKQLLGARRQLFTLKTPVTLENPHRKKELFDPGTIKNVYLVSVVLSDQTKAPLIENAKDQIIHLFDREFTEIILEELDTIADFTAYLKAKEKLTQEIRDMFIDDGEKQLLAWYILNNKNFDKLKGSHRVVLDRTIWVDLMSRPEYKIKKKMDGISYGWDSIIDTAHTASDQYELVARELARPSRFQRRALSKAFLDAHKISHADTQGDVFRRFLVDEDSDTIYCFLFGGDPEPRPRRRSMLASMCWILKNKYPKYRKVIGIATEKKIKPECSYDFCFLDLPEWTEEDTKYADELQKKTGIFLNPRIGFTEEDEYPICGNRTPFDREG